MILTMVVRFCHLGFVAIPLLALASCDRISGLRTDADFKVANPDCVDAAIQMTPGVGAVAYSMNLSASFQIAPYRGKVETLSHLWVYGPKKTAFVQLSYDGQSWKYFTGMVKLGSPWPSDQLDAYVPLMMRVNANVEGQCGLLIAERGHVERN